MADNSQARAAGQTRAILCIYCGARWDYTGNADTALAQMRAHDAECPQNPVLARASAAEAREVELVAIAAICDEVGIAAVTEPVDGRCQPARLSDRVRWLVWCCSAQNTRASAAEATLGKAREAERERCARAAERWGQQWAAPDTATSAAEHIAAAIRALKEHD